VAARRRRAARRGAGGQPGGRGRARPVPHDVGYGGLAVALAEAERWSGHAADIEPVVEPARGAAILAAAPDDVASLGSKGFVEIGQVR
jgi:hypothetical protein